MYALRVWGNVGLVCICAASASILACGSPDHGRGNSGQNAQVAGYGNYGGFSGYPFASGGFPVGGIGGAASGGGVIVGQGGIIASGGSLVGGAPPMGTGGVFDPGPEPTGQMIVCKGPAPDCSLDRNEACCIAASVNNGVVVSMSVNCQPQIAACEYPFTIAYCDGPEDCRQSEACCGTLKPFGTAQIFGDVSCVPAGECTGSQKFIVCRAGITQCPVGTSCGPVSTLPPAFNVCH